MDSSCRERKIVLEALDKMHWAWKRREEFSATFRWDTVHISIVRSYVFNLHLYSNSRLLTSARLLNATLPDYMPRIPIEYDKVVTSFTQELQEFFRVPSIEQLFFKDDTLKKNELLATFIDFLLQLLHHKVDFDYPFNDRVESLEKELRFPLSVLGDKPFLCHEQEEVQNILAEFEAVANEAGSLVHSYFFSLDSVIENIDKRLGVILGHIDLLKAKISDLLPLIPKLANTTPNRAAAGSVFIVDSLLHDLEDLLNRDDDQIPDVKDQIKTLHGELKFSQSLLKGIEMAPPHSGMEEMKETFIQIPDVAYEAVYLINTFLHGGCPLWYFSIRLTQVINKIKFIVSRFQEMKENKLWRWSHQKLTGQRSLQTKRDPEIADTIVGVEDTAMHILDQLEGRTKNLQIISIAGMPGLGKTTLARKLYNHPLVIEKFDTRIWCVISQTYERKGLLSNMLISSTREFGRDEILNMEEERLVEYIYKSLKGRRYLIIMDDIWSSNVWDDLRTCFPKDENGSRILFTSRIKDVVPPGTIIISLPFLSNDKSWELLEKKVFHDEPCPPELVGVGREIAAACHGLPLAVVVVAGILSTTDMEESAWEKVKENLASYFSDVTGNFIMRTLELSYNHLPDHLKPCFLYLGSFPEDTNIPIQKLIKLWIAEGFICKEEKKTVESVAEEYLMELIGKSLLQVTRRRPNGRGVKTCVLHDLLRDLCLRKAEEENFFMLINKNCSIYKRHHHRIVDYSYDANLRPFGLHVCSFRGSHVQVLRLVFLNMRLLRVLDCSKTRAGEWDDDDLDVIGLLIHLRYLAISNLLASIGNLVKLEYLSVWSSPNLVIPSVIGKMMNLRFLKFGRPAIFDKECDSSQIIINNVEYLSGVCIYEMKDEEMLKCWPNLRKLKCICGPLRVEDEVGVVYRYPDIRFFAQLESLDMSYRKLYYHEQPVEFNVPSTIKKLILYDFEFPWEKMSIIGSLPNLEVLKLLHHAFERGTWETKDGEFQQLRCLQLEGVSLVKWNVSSKEHLAKLQRISLLGCTLLEEIPSEIGEIETLELIEVHGCSKEAAESARKILEEQRDMGNDELRIIVDVENRRIYENVVVDEYIETQISLPMHPRKENILL